MVLGAPSTCPKFSTECPGFLRCTKGLTVCWDPGTQGHSGLSQGLPQGLPEGLPVQLQLQRTLGREVFAAVRSWHLL